MDYDLESKEDLRNILLDIKKAYEYIYKLYIAPNKGREDQKQDFLNKIQA